MKPEWVKCCGRYITKDRFQKMLSQNKQAEKEYAMNKANSRALVKSMTITNGEPVFVAYEKLSDFKRYAAENRINIAWDDGSKRWKVLLEKKSRKLLELYVFLGLRSDIDRWIKDFGTRLKISFGVLDKFKTVLSKYGIYKRWNPRIKEWEVGASFDELKIKEDIVTLLDQNNRIEVNKNV